MLLSWLKMVYIQIDFRMMNVKEWMRFRKTAKQHLKKFYSYKAPIHYEIMCFEAGELCWCLSVMTQIYPKLTDRFIAIHQKKLKDPVDGFKSGKYDLLAENGTYDIW